MKKLVTIFVAVLVSSSVFAADDVVCKSEALRYSKLIYSADSGNFQDVTTTPSLSKVLSNGISQLEVWTVTMVRNDGRRAGIYSHSLTLIPEKSNDAFKNSQCILVNFDRVDFLLSKDSYK